MSNKNILPNIVYPVNKGYVNDLKPTVHGTGEPGATINGQIDTTSFSSIVMENGVWSYKTDIEMANLTDHTCSITQTDSDGKTSPSISAKFKTDTNLLVSHTVTYPTNNQFINTKKPIIKGTGKPGASIELSLFKSVYTTMVNSDGNWQIQITEPIPEGFSSMSIIQKDMGNICPAINVSFTIDSVSPDEPILDTPADQSFVNNPKPIVSGKGESNATVDATVDEKNYTAKVNQQGVWSFEISQSLTEEAHIISAKQKDSAGNISPEKISLFTVKTKQPNPPVVLKPANGDFLSQSCPILNGQGEKSCRIEACVYDKVYSALVNDNGLWELQLSEELMDGTHTIKIYQVDTAGNVSPNVEFTIKIDTAIPAPPVILYPQKDSYVNKAVFTVKGTGEPDATIECTVADKNYTARVKNDGSWFINVSDNDNIKYAINYSISAKQIDLAGNTSSNTKINFRVDTECLKAPAITFPTDNSTLNTISPQFTGTGKPGATIHLNSCSDHYFTNVSSNGAWSISLGKSLTQGENIVNVNQTESGNVSPTNTITFKVDITAPASPIITFPTENQNFNSPTLTIKGYGEPNATINIKLDEKSYFAVANVDSTWAFNVTVALENGMHSMLVSQTDVAGNESAFSQVNFVISAQPNVLPTGNPTFQVFYNPPGPNWATKTIATLKTSMPVTINNIYGNSFSNIITANGIYHFQFTQPENNGNLTAGVTWIDNKPPVIQIETSGNYFSSDKTIYYYKPNGSPINYAMLNGAPFESGKSVTDEGVYKVQISDQAGNIAAEEFIIDKTPPTVLGIVDKMTYNSDVTITYSDNLSGIKSALLNGQNIVSEAVLTTNGDYQLTITDFGENKVERTFKIQK